MRRESFVDLTSCRHVADREVGKDGRIDLRWLCADCYGLLFVAVFDDRISSRIRERRSVKRSRCWTRMEAGRYNFASAVVRIGAITSWMRDSGVQVRIAVTRVG
jgi:hypothetical protein